MERSLKFMLIVTGIVAIVTIARISYMVGEMRGFNNGAHQQYLLDETIKPHIAPKIIPVPRTCPQEFTHPDSIREI